MIGWVSVRLHRQCREDIDRLTTERNQWVLAHAREEQARILLEKQLRECQEAYQDLAASVGSPARLEEFMQYLFVEPHPPTTPVYLTPESESED